MDYLPTVTARRAILGYWLVRHSRYTNTEELLRCQGFNAADILRRVKDLGVAESHIREMIGNSFTVTVFQRLFARLFPSVGLADISDPFH